MWWWLVISGWWAAIPARASGNDPAEVKVMVIEFNPRLASGKRLTEARNWATPKTMTDQLTSDIKQVSGGLVNYKVVTWVTEDEFPIKEDGFRYTEQSYLACLNNSTNCHAADTIDWLRFFNQYDICGKRDRGEMDELWLVDGPYFGVYESRMTGPGAYAVNSPPLTTSCRKPMFIQQMSYERPEETLHAYGHRMEAIMTHVYGGWQANRTAHNWDKFGLTRVNSPDYNYAGCGSIHYTPTAQTTSDTYVYDKKVTVMSNCDDFLNYPRLGDPQVTKKAMDCQVWGCEEVGYYRWWMSHFPRAAGTSEGKENNWWKYVANYQKPVTLDDFLAWRKEYLVARSGGTPEGKADFDGNGKVELNDFSVWRGEYLKGRI